MAAALSRVLATGSRDDFERLLARDLHWRGEDGAECRGRAAAGAFYARITAGGVLAVDAIRDVTEVIVTVVPHDRDARPSRHALALTIRDGLISEIVQSTARTRIQVLHVDGCPGYEGLLPRLRRLLDHHDMDVDLVTTRIRTDDDARRLRFLGSPTVRVNGRDVDPAAAGRTQFGLQCRLYRAADGTVSGAPTDTMILHALVDTSRTSPPPSPC